MGADSPVEGAWRVLQVDPEEGGTVRFHEPRSAVQQLGAQLCRERLAQALPLVVLARAICVTPAQLAAYETGAERMPAGLLVRVAEILGISVVGLFSRLPHLASSPGRLDRCGTLADSTTFRPSANSLRGLRVLVVEDDVRSAAFMGEALAWAGGRVIGPALDVQRAMSLLDAERPEVALLDVDMGSCMTSVGVAAALSKQGAPYLLVTGRDDLVAADPVLRAAPRLIKPVRPLDLVTAIASLQL